MIKKLTSGKKKNDAKGKGKKLATGKKKDDTTGKDKKLATGKKKDDATGKAKKLATGKKESTVGKVEIKIIVVIVYFTLMGVMGLMSISFYEFNNISNRLEEAFLCENSEEEECDYENDSFSAFAVLSVVAFALFAFAPVVAILFSFKREAFRKGKYTFLRLSK